MLQCGHKGADIVFTGTFKSWRKICRNRMDEALFQVHDPKLSVAGWNPVLVLWGTLEKVIWMLSN